MFTRGTHLNWVLDPWKFLSEEEAKTLLATAKRYASLARTPNRKTPFETARSLT
jgi:hypothetical protein